MRFAYAVGVVAAMHRQSILAGLCATTLAVTAAADPRQDFEAAFQAYREAVAEQRVDVAAVKAEEVLAIAEGVYPEDAPELAMLVFNHGFALGQAKQHDAAYPVLTRARALMRTAFGDEPNRMIRVEQALLNSSPPRFARRHLKRALELADARHGENNEVSADIKITGALRFWNKNTVGLLEEAAATFEWHENTAKFVQAKMWIGWKLLAGGRYREAVEPFAIIVDSLPADDRQALTARAHLIEAFEQLGERDLATEHCLAIGRTRPWTGTANLYPLIKKPPTYPPSQLASRAEGSVLLELTVDKMGFVKNPKVLESKGGSAFEAAALEALDGFRYAPRFVDGEPVEVEGVMQRIAFVLAD